MLVSLQPRLGEKKTCRRERGAALVSKVDEYRASLRELDPVAWDDFLLANSGLPGPRGNIELAQAVADEGDAGRFERYLTYTAAVAPANPAEEYFAFCGVVGMGRLLAEGDEGRLPTIRRSANDARWRIREGVAMALQRLGDADMDRLVAEMRDWASGTWLEQRAAAAALCEPRLLKSAEHSRATLEILDRITTSVANATPEVRRSEEFVALRKGLAYCWSVAAAALPNEGKAAMEKWFSTSDKDVRWIMRENLKKNRLAKVDPTWVEASAARLSV